MRKFFFPIFLFSLLSLTSCGGASSGTDTSSGKTAFYIETLDLSASSGTYTVESSARLTAGSTLTLSSEGVGQVQEIPLKEGDFTQAGWALVKLSDTVGMYGIQLRQAQVGVKTQSTSLETTRLSLDRAVADAETALAQAQRAYDTLTRDVAEQEKQAKLDYDNADPTNTGSVASMNIEKLQLDLEKANQDYENTITNLDANFHLYANEVDKTVTAMLYDGDKILGISEYWEHNNDVYEPLLGTQLGNIKNDSDNNWGNLYAAIGALRADKDLVITRDNIEAETAKVTAVYTAARNFNSSMITMFQNTLIGGGLTQAQIDGWISLYTGYKSQITAGDAGFSAWKSQAVTGLGATETSLDSLKAQLAIAEKNIETSASGASIGYTRTLIGLQDAQRSAELALDQAQRTLDTAKRNRDLGISQANVGIENAQISLLQAQTNYGKLTIDAPISGKITKILVSPGESLNAGTPAVEMVSLEPEISLDIEKAVAYGIQVGDAVSIEVSGKTLSGTIIAVSRIANSNLLYTTRISVPAGESMIGQSAKVFFTVRGGSTTSSLDLSLPLDMIRIVSENEGQIYLLTRSGSELLPEAVSIQLGAFRGESIEVLTSLPTDAEIIMTSIENFDPEKQKLIKETK